MTARTTSGRRFTLGGGVVPLLDAVIEGAWIAVLDATFAVVGGTTALGPIPFALAAGAALYISRHAADRRTGLVLLGALYIVAFVGGGLLGGTLSGGATTAGQPLAFAQAAGVFMALAVFRGSRHVDVIDDDLVTGSLLQWGFPLLAVPWLYASQLTGAERDVFAATAFPSTLLFAAAGMLALGLGRLDSLAGLSGVNWRTNRAWWVLLLSVLGVMLLIAIPSAFLLGTPLLALAAGLMGPLAFVLTPVAFVFEKLIAFLFFLISPLTDFLMGLARRRAQEQPPIPGGLGDALVPPVVPDGEPSIVGLIVLGGIVVIVAVLLFLLILRLTYGPRARDEAPPEGPLEEREFRLPSLALHRPHFGLPQRRVRPTSASGAYLAFLADLEATPHLARRPDEPPATHAGRLRENGFRDPRAGLLAADYQLERYALRVLPARETSRALRRWQALKDVIRTAPRPRTPTEGPD